MLDTSRLVAMTKRDLLDEELNAELTELDRELPIPYLFISSITQQGLVEHKDALWKMLNEK